MRILILEDDKEKAEIVRSHLIESVPGASVRVVDTFIAYCREISNGKVDLLVLDLVVPRHTNANETVGIEELIEVTRGDYRSPNFRTPGVVLTAYDERAEEHFRLLNQYDFGVVTFERNDGRWMDAIDRKIANLPVDERFDFVIFCALEKEAEGFLEAKCEVYGGCVIGGLMCRVVHIGERKGVIVIAPRIGLVSAAITATQAINLFRPQLICLSGICGGNPDECEIYDVVVAETCHQHDVGKWEDGRLVAEVYSVAIDHQFAQRAKVAARSDGFVERIRGGIEVGASEFPDGVERFAPRVKFAPASSGSAVVADEVVRSWISDQQRKVACFEMEAYSVYEAARLSSVRPTVFSAKAVVDEGTLGKSDKFHRVGCILSARVAVEFISVFEFREGLSV